MASTPNIVDVTESDFADAVLTSSGSKPVLVDFWATWCAPCRMMSPIIDELSEESPDDVLVAKVNVDQEQQLAHEHRVMSIPTLVIFKNGEEIDRIVGVTSKDRLTSYFEKKGE